MWPAPLPVDAAGGLVVPFAASGWLTPPTPEEPLQAHASVDPGLQVPLSNLKDSTCKSRFHKTKLCTFHLTGRCRKKATCNFAHSQAELQMPPEQSRKFCGIIAGNCSDGVEDAPLSLSLPGGGAAADLGDFPPTPTSPGSDIMAASFMPACGSPRGSLNAELPHVPVQPDPSHANESAQAPAKGESGMRKKFCKTKMCRFHAVGRCRKRDACNFAHDEQELKALPNLYRTKLCPTMLNTGTCENAECRYAHDLGELRSVEAEASAGGAVACQQEVEVPTISRQSTVDPHSPGASTYDGEEAGRGEALPDETMLFLLPSPVAALRIKNTFLDVELPGGTGMRRVRSSPELPPASDPVDEIPPIGVPALQPALARHIWQNDGPVLRL